METLTITVDGQTIEAEPGQTIMAACDANGIYIPRLCDSEGLEPAGSCRVCVTQMNGRHVAACTQPVEAGAIINNECPEIQALRRDLVAMLLHEGNHLCPICEASGRCELQALAYRLGVVAGDKYPYLQPVRAIDAGHPEIALDTNRCILCARCIRASRDVDHKHVFGYVGRGVNKRLGVSNQMLAHTNMSLDDEAAQRGVCPVGCIIRKGEGFFAPMGERQYDAAPIDAKTQHPQHSVQFWNASEDSGRE